MALLQQSEMFTLFGQTSRSFGALVVLVSFSYKCLAALRPSSILSANFRNTTLRKL